ncbi:MAG: DUF1800 domain-containing protein [Winogradskyella sp.]|uniref:DUF1800 domain-containing protein n=1 Tax=Winogradskyella sp. TaxID=1883156 RepID=UPI000F3FACC3|nr:DUF1800 domain-containing protein [Winogradskyella sp.]RNC88335.1 MAG: DUF1800 domain-containing protein [Winogradskyella sp.]
MAVTTSCNSSTIQPYIPSAINPWDEARVRHAYRRIGYDASKAMVTAALAMSPNDFIDQLVDEAFNEPNWPTPVWADYTNHDYDNLGLDFEEETQNNHHELRLEVINKMQNNGLKGRLILFWSNHFVTELESYFASNLLYEYYHTLERHALGNFREFVYDIGRTSAMLVYLNGFENTNNSPNENYARELYELFTLGVDNGYTQQDIVETSKALTGFNHRVNWTYPINYDSSTFDNSVKTIFNREGNWGYDEVIAILFEEKSPLIAQFICRKLYTYFISPEPNEVVISAMADSFGADFNIANVLKLLFKSEHFFDEKSLGTKIKSPFDLTMSYLKVTGFTMQPDYLDAFVWYNNMMGQYLFNPVDVAGWQGDKDWINSSTITIRWQIFEWIIWHTLNEFTEELRTFAIESSGDSNDPYIITKSIIDRFVPLELFTPTDYQIATDIFKHNIPQNYYDDGSWNLQWDTVPNQVVLLLFHIIKMPEFQLI